MKTPLTNTRPDAQRVPTIRDVAALVCVSTATVSHVINNSRRTSPGVRARVEEAITLTRYEPSHEGRMLALCKADAPPKARGV